MKLKKDFKHELILDNMLGVELADDRIFKYPDEYQVFDDAKEKDMKSNFVPASISQPNGKYEGKHPDEGKYWDDQKNMLTKFYRKDDRDYESDEHDRKRLLKKEKALEAFMTAAAIKYTEWRKAREDKSAAAVDPNLKKTQRRYIAEVYQRLMNTKGDNKTDAAATEAAKKRFPHPMHLIFGYDAKQTETIKQSYPETFKRYFFRMVKAIVKINNKTVLLKKPSPMIMAVGAKDGVDKTKNVNLQPF